MQVPKRHKEAFRKYGPSDDRHLTREALERLRRTLTDLEKNQRPKAVEDLRVAAAMGDLSENAAYSEAKGRLMGIDGRIFSLKERLKNAIVIEAGPAADGRVCLGATVVVKAGTNRRVFTIVGPQETDPTQGRISHLSPLGAALLEHGVGDCVTLKTPYGETLYEIVEVR